jgi:hypothetical protein
MRWKDSKEIEEDTRLGTLLVFSIITFLIVGSIMFFAFKY